MHSPAAMSLEKYVAFVSSGRQSGLTVNLLNQEMLLDAVKTMDLIDPSRSTLKECISSRAILEIDDVIADLNALDWHECRTTSIKTLSKENLHPATAQDDPGLRKRKGRGKGQGKGKGNAGIDTDGKCPSSGKKKKKLLKQITAAPETLLLKQITAGPGQGDDDVGT